MICGDTKSSVITAIIYRCIAISASPLAQDLVLLVSLVERVHAHDEVGKGEKKEGPVETDCRPHTTLFA